MSVQSTEVTQNFENCDNVTWPVWISRVAGDPNKAVFRDGASSPSLTSGSGKPIMSNIMMHVHRVGQGQEHIDVEEIGAHGVSSRSSLTMSRVMILAFG